MLSTFFFFYFYFQQPKFVHKKDFEVMDKKQERMQTSINEFEMQIHAIKESIKGQQIGMENQLAKIRDLNETLYKIDNVQIPALNTRLSQMMTRDEFVGFKKEHDQQVNPPLSLLLLPLILFNLNLYSILRDPSNHPLSLSLSLK